MKLFLILIIYVTTIFTPVVEDEKIPWREGEKLTWEMFKGNQENVGNFVASTNSGISLSFGIRTIEGKTKVDYDVQSYFYPNNSWYNKDKVNATILAHEQTHFDISELFARKLRAKFYTISRDRNFKEMARTTYKENEEDRVKMQDKFDRETNHSRIELAEIYWESYIEGQLKLYDDWK